MIVADQHFIHYINTFVSNFTLGAIDFLKISPVMKKLKFATKVFNGITLETTLYQGFRSSGDVNSPNQ